MPREELPQAGRDSLLAVLGRRQAARFVDYAAIDRSRLPRRFRFGPQLTIAAGDRMHLIHELASAEIPKHVAVAAKLLEATPDITISILVRDLPGQDDPARLASPVLTTCAKLKIGLLLELTSGIAVALPPGFALPRPRRPRSMEFGHIPSWLLDRLEQTGSFSEHLSTQLARFTERYREATAQSAPSNTDESRLLHRLARGIADGDERLFFPAHLLHTLEGYEQGGADGGARDHFFHTFINLFTGLVILGELFGNRRPAERPDRFIRDTHGSAKMKPWETLWSLTCLFHDPGYMGQNIWCMLHSAFGLPFNAREAPEIPDAIKEMIARGWDEYRVARSDLLGLFRTSCGYWTPGSCGPDVADRFDDALRSAYFDEFGPNHSIISALGLIQRCRNYSAVTGGTYDRDVALRACEIAGLCMLFHDQRCRVTLGSSGLLPVAFEELPYATMLMFVDAIQDDRRDIAAGAFPRRGLLDALTVNAQERSVTAIVDLRRTSPVRWPYLISEFENVTSWINRESDTKFIIDYTSRAKLTV